MSRSLGAYWRAETGLFLGLWVTLLAVGGDGLFHDPGTLWHAVLGRRMLDSGRLVEADPFSFTFGGRPWIPHSWLAECLMGAIGRSDGRDGLLLATATLLAVLYTWAGHRLLRAGLHPLPTALLVAMTVAASSMHFHVRPHLATIVFLGITCGWIVDYEAGRIGLGRLATLVPLFVAWSNLHGGMPAGLATLGLAVAGWVVVGLAGGDSPVRRPRQALALGGLLLACGLTPLVNPYGLRLPRAWAAIAGSPLLPRIIMEHAPATPRDPDFWMIAVLGAVYGAILAGTWPRWPRVTWLLPLAWFVLALERVRNAPLFAISALVILPDVLAESRLSSWLARPGRDLFRRADDPPQQAGWRAAALPAAAVAAALVLHAAGVRAPLVGRGWARLDPATWPVELLPDLARADRAHPEGSRIFNDFGLGGFLIEFAPNLKVFIDDRCELYGDAFLGDYWDAQTRHPERIDAWLASYRVPYALVRAGSGFDRHLARAPGWTLVRRDRVGAFFRREPPGAASP